MSLDVNDVRFWHCPVNAHTAIVWEGAIARCEECGITSDHTSALIERGHAEQRHDDVLWLQDQARLVRTASETGSDLPVSGMIPAKVLEAVAELLAGAPIGNAED